MTSETVLFATAELAPAARVGGLAEAAAGLVKALRASGSDVIIALPDYGTIELSNERSWELQVPEWAGPARARRGEAVGVGDLILIDRPGLSRPHPYVEPGSGQGWPDNDHRFLGFSAAVAALCLDLNPDVLHLNDWHTAATLGFLATPPPSVLTIHTLGYQGLCKATWLQRIPYDSWKYAWYDSCNPLLGAIRSADKIIAVSPNYASEILTEDQGQGLHEELARRGADLVGIRNGIDTSIWDPRTDQIIPRSYTDESFEFGKAEAKQSLLDQFGWEPSSDPILGVVSRLVDQKGIDLIANLGPFLKYLPARLVLLGSGQAELASLIRQMASEQPHRIGTVTDRYDEDFAHRIFAGSDLFLMPSRFEPCGLAQMQAMAYGTPPVATPVGGLVDTIIDADAGRALGTGFLSLTPDLAGFVDALHRAVRAHRSTSRRRGIQRRGMMTDWSWQEPAAAHRGIYADLLSPSKAGT